MAQKEYTFVAQKGLAYASSDLNIRQNSPSKGAAVAKIVATGGALPFIGYVLDGEAVGCISKWFLTPDGDFFWSGNVSLEKEKTEESSIKILRKPLDTLVCTQRFKERPEFYKNLGSPKGHNGMDFRTKKPNGTWIQNVYATLDGVISEATENQWNGKFVRIVHPNNFESVYLHLSEVGVKKGQRIKGAAKIGLSGNSGAASEAPHLHFGYRPVKFDKNNGYMGYIDPALFFIDEIQYLS